MTGHDAQKADYLSSWKVFFLNTLGWSGARVSEWMRETGTDRLLEDYESWLYHDPPVVWAVEALLSHVLPERSSSKAVIVVRNEILGGFAGEDYQVSLNTDWLLHRRRINQALKRYGIRLPQAGGSPLIRRTFPESTMHRGAGSSFASHSSEKTMQHQFKTRRPNHDATPPSGLSTREFAGV